MAPFFILLFFWAGAHVTAKHEQSHSASDSSYVKKGDVILEKERERNVDQDDYRPDCRNRQFIELLKVVHNNLGGKGPDSGEHSMTYNAERCVGYNEGCEPLSIKLTLVSHEYEWNDGKVNGIDVHFGVIDLPPWAEADFKMEFLYPQFSLRGSGAMELDKAFLTFYDLDVSDAGPEYIILPNEFETMLSSNTSIEKEEGNGDTTKYKATRVAKGEDTDENPKKPLGLSQRQRDNCVTISLNHTSTVTFSARSTKHFAFVSPFDCKNKADDDHPATTTTTHEKKSDTSSHEEEGSDRVTTTTDEKATTVSTTTTPETVHVITRVNDSKVNDTLVNITHHDKREHRHMADKHNKDEAKDVAVGAVMGIVIGGAILSAVLLLLACVKCLRQSKFFYQPVSTDPSDHS